MFITLGGATMRHFELNKIYLQALKGIVDSIKIAS